MRGFTRKILAILLLFLFVEKVGLRLFLHTRIHQDNVVNSKQKNTTKQSISQQDCGCLDDFLIPLTQVEETGLPSPTITYIHTVSSYRYISIYTSPNYSSWLRGPPAFA